ncbi:hypothetical protein GE09DRAFT_1247168 [Coniochaeta sp. 2T2.1]|nr:hypothetical protein GE09DRAFT_1247168 [Coniochaeta sp. 2T2.1]
MAPQAQAIDLTGVGDTSPPAAPTCGNPHHAEELRAVRANRRKLFACLKDNRDLREAAASHAAELARRDNIINELGTRDEVRINEIARLKAEKAALEDRLSGRGKRQNRTWPEKLQAFIVDGKRMPSYDTIHSLCCKEENMSSNSGLTHPLIRLTGSSNDWKLSDGNVPQGQSVRTFPRFHALPAHIQARIFQLWLHKDRPVHCLSRLDPFRAPTAWPVANSTSGLINRFYWGDERSLNMTEDTVDPQEALALLLVSKDFYFKGVHAFYGLNMFAFSSIGEFSRFANGIGQLRATRIQHLDIIWTGSQYLTAAHTFSTNKKGKQVENWDSARTRPLTLLLKLPRLRTLAVFLAESNPRYQRRKYESPEVKAKLLAATADQPNFRQNRSLRTLQGADCLHLLRGLDWVKVYDLNLTVRDVNPVPELRPIRDKSFLVDISKSVTTPKSAKQAEASELQRLPPLFPLTSGGPQAAQPVNPASPMQPRDPSGKVFSTIQKFYHDSQRRGPYQNSLNQTWYGFDVTTTAEGYGILGATVNAERPGAANDARGPPMVVEGPANVAALAVEGVDGNTTAADANERPASIAQEQAKITNGDGTANAGVEATASTAATVAKRNVTEGETSNSTQGYAATRVVTLNIAPRQLLAIINDAAARADGMAADVDMTDAVQDPSTGTHGGGPGPIGASSVRGADTLHNPTNNGSIFVDDDAMQPEGHNGRNSQRPSTRPSSQKHPTQRYHGTGRRALGPLSPAVLNARRSNTNRGPVTPNKRPSDAAGPANTRSKRRRASVGPSGTEPITNGSSGVISPTIGPVLSG